MPLALRLMLTRSAIDGLDGRRKAGGHLFWILGVELRRFGGIKKSLEQFHGWTIRFSVRILKMLLNDRKRNFTVALFDPNCLVP